MATTTSHNKKSSAVKRILSEARELKEPTAEFATYPLDDNIFEWHFTLRGPSGSEFEQGMYHGRILLPVEYPFRPPDVMILTPNGRWELNKKICLTFTGFHEEMWQPAWGIRTALIGVQAFMAARAEAAIGVGSLDFPTEERERLAKISGDWTCPVCEKKNRETLSNDEGPRVLETLPEGLTIDPTGGKAQEHEADAGPAARPASASAGSAAQETDAASQATSCKQPLSSAGVEGATSMAERSFGAEGPTNAMLEQMIRTRLDTAALHPSISSSQTSTPGHLTPQPAEGEPALSSGKGKERDVRDAASSNGATASQSTPAVQQRPSLSQRPSMVSSFRASFYTASLRPAQASSSDTRSAGHRASSAEASAQRLAALDRAIATVIFLLAALMLRRLLNAWP